MLAAQAMSDGPAQMEEEESEVKHPNLDNQINKHKARLMNIPEDLCAGSLNDLSVALSLNMVDDTMTFDGHHDQDTEPGKLFIYGAFTTTIKEKVALLGYNTRSGKGPSFTEVERKVFHYRVQSPDGPYCYNVKYKVTQSIPSMFDPSKHPYNVFEIDADKIDFETLTITIKDATILNEELMRKKGAKELFKLPKIRGKIALDDKKQLAFRPFDLRGDRATGRTVWKPDSNLLGISKQGNYTTLSTLAKGDEVFGTLAMGHDGKPYVTCVAKATMLKPDDTISGTNIHVESEKFLCTLTNQWVDPRATCIAFETPTHICSKITETLGEILNSEKYLSFVPADGYAALYSKDHCHTITAAEVDKQLEKEGLSSTTRWNQITMEELHDIFINSRSPEQKQWLIDNGYMDTELKANWVVHHNHDNISLAATKMVINSYKPSNTSKDTVKCTLLITKGKLSGRAGDIESMSQCGNVSERYTNVNGYEVPLIERDYAHYLTNSLIGKEVRKPLLSFNKTMNLDLTIHKLTTDGHRTPAVEHTLGDNGVAYVGDCLIYSVLYAQNNKEVKKLLIDLTSKSTDDFSHCKIRYINGDANQIEGKVAQNSLKYGRFREILLELQPKSKEDIIGLLNAKGAFVGRATLKKLPKRYQQF